MKNFQEKLIEILKELYLKGNESEFLNVNEFIVEMEDKLYRYLANNN